MPTIGDFTSSSFAFAGSALGGSSCTAGIPATGVVRASAIGAGMSVGIGIEGATCTAPRCCGDFEMRIFIPLSEEISMESTVDSSSISTSFFT